MSKKIILGILAFTLGFAAAYYMTKPTSTAVKQDAQFDKRAIVRLIDPETMRFICTGVVVNNAVVISAAHCVTSPFAVFGVQGSSFLYLQYDGKPNALTLMAVEGVNQRGDTTILSGSLEGSPTIPYMESTKEVLEAIQANNLIMCGYPSGGDLLCVRFDYEQPYVFQSQGKGQVFPGMSGGPVIDLNTGKVVGVVSAMTENRAIISPLVEIKTLLQRK